jgi:ERCC4-related helicase
MAEVEVIDELETLEITGAVVSPGSEAEVVVNVYPALELSSIAVFPETSIDLTR